MPNERDDWRYRRYWERDRDDDRYLRHRDDERRSVGSPGIGGGTGGMRDRDRERYEEERRYAGGGDESWSPPQTSLERMGRGWGGDVGETSMRGMTSTGERGHTGRGPMNYTRADHRIHEDVCDLLTEDDELDASEIDVRVERGEVTLTGHVANREMKRRAEEIADHVSGVRDIHHQLRIRGDRDRNGNGGMRS